jgi:hypothetical protein
VKRVLRVPVKWVALVVTRWSLPYFKVGVLLSVKKFIILYLFEDALSISVY